MEDAARPKKQSRIYGILATLLWMLVSFIGGIFVGMHPEWVPNMPWAYHPDIDHAPPTTMHSQYPMDLPQTQQSPPTQPSPTEH
jgi:hypothetical protein